MIQKTAEEGMGVKSKETRGKQTTEQEIQENQGTRQLKMYLKPDLCFFLNRPTMPLEC